MSVWSRVGVLVVGTAAYDKDFACDGIIHGCVTAHGISVAGAGPWEKLVSLRAKSVVRIGDWFGEGAFLGRRIPLGVDLPAEAWEPPPVVPYQFMFLEGPAWKTYALLQPKSMPWLSAR